MHRASPLWLALLSSLLPACVSTSHDSVQPLVSINSGIQINPDSEYLRGKLLHLQARYDEAEQAYLSVLTVDENHAEARNGLAALIGARGDLDRSIALLSSMAQSDTRLPQVYINLGHAWIKKGQLREARRALERALELDPANPAAQEKMALLLSLNEPSSAQVAQITSVADPGIPIPSVNPVERLSDGLYVLRYSVPLPEPLPQKLQEPADVALDRAPGNITEPAADNTDPHTRSDFYENRDAPSAIPTLAIGFNNEVKHVTDLAARITVSYTRDDFVQDIEPTHAIPTLAVVLKGEVKNVTETATQITVPDKRPDFSKDGQPQHTLPALAIEVANGNGVQGLARSLRGLLNGQSWRVVRARNHEQFAVRFTRIEYVSNLAQDAKILADALGIDAQFRLNNQQTGTQIRIILGHDLKDLSKIRQRLAAAAQATRTSSVIYPRLDRTRGVN